MIKLSNSNVKRIDYSEAAALEQMLRAADETLAEMNDGYEKTNDDIYLDVQFTISVGGISTAFLLGGPQMQALCNFVQSIADENGYSVDFETMTVSE